MPRPMRLRSRRDAAGFRFERFSSSGIRLAPALDRHEVADLPEHTDERWALLMLGRPADLAQPESPQRAAVALRLADLATRLRDLQLRHSSPPVPPSAASAPGAPARSSGRGSARRPRADGAA